MLTSSSTKVLLFGMMTSLATPPPEWLGPVLLEDAPFVNCGLRCELEFCNDAGLAEAEPDRCCDSLVAEAGEKGLSSCENSGYRRSSSK